MLCGAKSATDLSNRNGPENGQLGYSEGLLIAAAVSVIYTAGSRMGLYSETRTMTFHWSDAEFTLWNLSRISCWPS